LFRHDEAEKQNSIIFFIKIAIQCQRRMLTWIDCERAGYASIRKTLSIATPWFLLRLNSWSAFPSSSDDICPLIIAPA
jgi:hypothetical protein